MWSERRSEKLENLRYRIMAGGPLRPQDALLLRDLEIPPFVDAYVFELSSDNAVVRVGNPDCMHEIFLDTVNDALQQCLTVPSRALEISRQSHRTGSRRKGVC